MITRKFTPSDASQLSAFWELVFPDNTAHNAAELVIEKKLAIDDLIFLSLDEEQIIASCMVGYDGHRGWLYSVAVHPNYRRRGIGQQLVQHSLKQLRALGCIKVNLQIRADNTAVANFYRSLGFAVEDRLSMGMRMEEARDV